MTQWYVKELSKLTSVSVQTLHHYDRIDLLKPSVRLPNGYRLYSEKDLLRLQQIIALKFFGFELSHIKTLLTSNINMVEHFCAQAQFLEKKAKTLQEASQTLKNIVSQCSQNESIPWKTIIELIEVYRMTEQLDHAWVKEILTPEELKQYAHFQADLKTKFSLDQKTHFEKNWSNLLKKMSQHLNEDPKSDIGFQLGKECMDLINGLYGTKYAHLRTKIFEKGFGEGKGLEAVALTPETVAWLEVAVDTYWRQRIYSILDQVGKTDSAKVLILWNEVLVDLYGDDPENRKSAALEMAMVDERVSDAAKKWLLSLK